MIKVAIVEDEKASRDNIENILHRYDKEKGVNFKITCFDNAVDFITDYISDFDLVLMDIDMPHMSGLEAAKRLRINNPLITLKLRLTKKPKVRYVLALKAVT